MATAPFRVLLDASVPDSVGHVFAGNGHTVIYHREVLPDALIEHEWAYTDAKAARRLWIDVEPHTIRTHR